MMNGGPDKAQLFVAIEQAFKGVRLEDGTSLNMTKETMDSDHARENLAKLMDRMKAL